MGTYLLVASISSVGRYFCEYISVNVFFECWAFSWLDMVVLFSSSFYVLGLYVFYGVLEVSSVLSHYQGFPMCFS